MREIHFRAWDVFNGIYYHSKESNLYRFFKCVEEAISGGNTVVVEQYTGLKDCKGKDIYEGDILDWKHFYVYGDTDGIKKVDVVVFRAGAFVCKRYGKLARDFGYQQPCEIIGNIHENPELLEAKES